jgi:hypothetical protein
VVASVVSTASFYSLDVSHDGALVAATGADKSTCLYTYDRKGSRDAALRSKIEPIPSPNPIRKK